MPKTLTCTAKVDNELRKKNLCHCIKIIGGTPVTDEDTVKVTVPYPSDMANQLLLLYEQYWTHEIIIREY